ncbi:hypothetical protein BKA65DRAFT_590407 [Rhexocercosporidium sp. MPI-PUGE-AT-0058]|nr:hypothetical protein BKA65DRAFT_590407 [Rhexocercosporidium sp. MPI-PUGE-AT-0058]
MADLAPLSLSQTKEELLKYLNLPQKAYALMAKETVPVYIWMISDKSHLKDNCMREPPYDWHDFKEQWKDEAINQLLVVEINTRALIGVLLPTGQLSQLNCTMVPLPKVSSQ